MIVRFRTEMGVGFLMCAWLLEVGGGGGVGWAGLGGGEGK